MDDVIFIDEQRAARAAGPRPSARPRVTFYFDLASPWSYLAAERVDRSFHGVRWEPAFGDAFPEAVAGEDEAARRAAETRADELAMPLVWPETSAVANGAAMRVASFAAERERAAPFVLAASRLAFCGGFDIDDPEILAEAAAAAGLALDEALLAAADRTRDAAMRATSAWLVRHGAETLPAVAVGRTLFCGEHQLVAAAAAIASQRVRRVRSPTGPLGA